MGSTTGQVGGQARQEAVAMLHRPVGRGAQYWGPGDKYTFLIDPRPALPGRTPLS